MNQLLGNKSPDVIIIFMRYAAGCQYVFVIYGSDIIHYFIKYVAGHYQVLYMMRNRTLLLTLSYAPADIIIYYIRRGSGRYHLFI